jgi:hypothetical protein
MMYLFLTLNVIGGVSHGPPEMYNTSKISSEKSTLNFEIIFEVFSRKNE